MLRSATRPSPVARGAIQTTFKLPFLSEEVPHFWIKNNKSLFDNYDFARKKLDEWMLPGMFLK